MRRLDSVRLVQWYHFQDESFPVGGSCLLLGDNGSGKTTVLDAIQVALVADLSEVLLNRAANEKSRRSLHGYVRWKLGSEDESKPGSVRFGRGACTSYVLLEFVDDVDPAAAFTCGMGFEATESDTDLAKLYFVVPGARAADVDVVAGAADDRGQGTVLPIREFRTWLRSHGGRPLPDAGTYREEIRQRLGVLPESFHRLIVKALAFKPIGQVRQFVFDYLLDPRPIDTAALQANLEHYKRLEGEAKEAQRRIDELEAIVREGERIRTEQRTAESHRFMEHRADREAAQTTLDGIDQELAAKKAELLGLNSRKESIRAESEGLDRERERLKRLLEGYEVYRQVQSLDLQIEQTAQRLRDAEDADREARTLLAVQTDALGALLSERARAFRRARPEMFERDDLLGAEEPPEVVSRLRATLAAEGALAGRDLATWERRLDRGNDRVREARMALLRELEDAKREGAVLQEEQRTLESGRQRYPDGPAALLHLLRSRLKGRREPKPLCELVEVPNPRWRDAVEGYLNTRRFDVIVAPEDYPRALGLYERHKRDYALPGRGNVFIGGVGLVDVERLVRTAPRCEARSLAEQVETNDAYARAYCDFVLGDVVCVDDEQALRKHKSAITDTVMVYRNHVARQTQRDVYARHYVGEAARVRRLDQIATRLGALHTQLVATAGQVEWLDKTVRLLDGARMEARRLRDLVDRAEGVGRLRIQGERLAQLKAKLDRSEIRDLEAARNTADARRDKLDAERETVQTSIGAAEEAIRNLGEKSGEARAALDDAEKLLRDFAAGLDGPTLDSYEQRYLAERAERAPADIHSVFERQRKIIETRVSNLILDLVAMKSRYVDRRGFLGAVQGAQFEEFSAELEAWRDSRLPDYQAKISDAKAKALEQLAEDVVFRLRENLLLVRRQINELNTALKDVPFGTEQYWFTVEVDPEHRDFHDLVMGAGQFQKESLFGAAALAAPELKATLGGLLDRLVEAEAKQVKTELEARADYREYFRYDLKIIHADGTHSFYDKVAGDKSGGETQTPYYIAILASMYRLYRSRSLDGRPTCGLVLLDEAFGKMDESRIAATLTFARRLELQLVLATPKERSELVAPKVERSLLIHKDAIGGMPTVLDFTKEFVRDEQEDAVAADGTARQAAGGPRT